MQISGEVASTLKGAEVQTLQHATASQKLPHLSLWIFMKFVRHFVLRWAPCTKLATMYAYVPYFMPTRLHMP